MRVLWTVNILLPEAESLLSGCPASLNSSGGWLLGTLSVLSGMQDMKLAVACPSGRVAQVIKLEGERITYYIFPGVQPTGEPFTDEGFCLDRHFEEICADFKPDLVDIHGTEYAHSYSASRVRPDLKKVVTLQGILSECGRAFHYGLSVARLLLNARGFKSEILAQKKDFLRRSALEAQLLENTRFVIGRTDFDRSCVARVNPGAEYFSCNESLREEFYTGKWEYSRCVPHSIFLSQASYPLKGLHKVLEDLPAIAAKYPDVRLCVAGGSILDDNFVGLNEYGRLVGGMIRKKGLGPLLEFTGALNAAQMKQRYLSSNVFVCPSTVENSPNSLAEAQILGVPCVAARVGGIPDMIRNGACGTLYDFNEAGALAQAVCTVFEKGAGIDTEQMRQVAAARHDTKANVRNLVGIYSEILGK